MDLERWRRIDDLFDQLFAAPPDERRGMIAESCAGDAELQYEVTSLLASASESDASIRDIIAAEVEQVAAGARTRMIGRRLGPYRVQTLLGEGGMGVVYLAARDDAQFAQQVAIKILPHALGSPQAVARFRDERQILAALDHRNIVRLLDGGNTDDDLPYLVMEHIEGRPITAYAREHRLSIRARVQLVRDVCSGIQYAHQNLIIHRDIKPDNILVDVCGTPKLLDFGIAKLLGPSTSFAREARTHTGNALFTPEYASPEQARGEAVSTATDVYSIGAVLYELVTGRPPHRAAGGLMEILRVICETDPLRPSMAGPAERRRELAGDLDNIILKALHKDPARRYATVEQLSDDLGRFLEGLPVKARVATFGYRLRKFAGRNKAAVVAATFVAVTLVAATAISLRQAQRADAQARRADAAAEDARAEQVRALSEAERARAEAERARGAERQIQVQLDQIKAEQAARQKAENQARLKDDEAEMTREQLRVALEKARREKSNAERESQRAREARRRALRAAESEMETRRVAEALYQREKERAESLERLKQNITNELP